MSDVKFPSSSDKDPRRARLGGWLCRQRSLYRQGQLPQSRVRKLERFSEWKWGDARDPDSVSRKKLQLLDIARKGETRPRSNTKLGIALYGYLYQNGAAYDPDFDQQIKTVAPQWFIDEVKEKKQKLLEMAQRGEPRPSQKRTQSGRVLGNYTRAGSTTYDPDFDQTIRELAPAWFVNTADENKKKLLEMAQAGKSRPAQRTKLGPLLTSYTHKKQSHKSYDPDFDQTIRKLAPLWFANTADAKKLRLLKIAQAGEPRPSSRKTKLGIVMTSYVAKSSSTYDPDFDQTIRELAPDWFVDNVTENKKKLLEMAQAGESRPAQRIKLGSSLSRYTGLSHKSYDPDFDQTIRKLAPLWFANTADAKKLRLLKIAQAGEPRPHREVRLAQALASYISKNGGAYDPKFDKRVRALAPHWFVRPKQYKGVRYNSI